MNSTKSIKVTKSEGDKIYSSLIQKGFREESQSNPYVVWRLRGSDTTIMLYTSGSLVAQGEMADILDSVQGRGSDISEYPAHLGSDEVGKGDYFGPLVVCCAFVDSNIVNRLRELGVMDSKKLSDSKILDIYNSVKDLVPHQVCVQTPVDYEMGCKKYGNVSIFLAALHAQTANSLLHELKTKPEHIVVDQFSNREDRLVSAFKNINIKLVQFHKGESDIAVAIASVIARAIFLIEFKSMCDKYNFDFPKGSSIVIDSARDFVSKFGIDELRNVAKISFQTTKEVTSLF